MFCLDSHFGFSRPLPPYLPLLSVRVPPAAPRLHRLAARRHELQPEPRVQGLLERRGAAPVGGDAHVGDASDELHKLGCAELGGTRAAPKKEAVGRPLPAEEAPPPPSDLDLALSAMSGAVAEIDAKQYKVDLQFVGEEQKQAYVENYLD